MSRKRNNLFSLPGIKRQPTKVPTISPQQLPSPIHSRLKNRYHNIGPLPNGLRSRQSRQCSQKQLIQSKHSQLITMLDSERKKSEDISKIIDARKSIKILIDYFQSQNPKNSDQKFRNVVIPRKRLYTQPQYIRLSPQNSPNKQTKVMRKIQAGDIKVLSLSKNQQNAQRNIEKEDSQSDAMKKQQKQVKQSLLKHHKELLQIRQRMVVVVSPSSVQDNKFSKKWRRKQTERQRITHMRGWQTFEETDYIE